MHALASRTPAHAHPRVRDRVRRRARATGCKSASRKKSLLSRLNPRMRCPLAKTVPRDIALFLIVIVSSEPVGKFENGAVTGAFGYMFNYCSNGVCTSKLEQALYDWMPGYKAGTLIYNQTAGDGSWTGWEVVDAVSVGASVAGKGLQIASEAARQASKVEVFAARGAPELKEIFNWGNGLPGVQEARAALDVNRMTQITNSITRTEVESIRNMYNAAAAVGRGGLVAPARAQYMNEILKKW